MKPILKIKNLKKKYDKNGPYVLKDISFEVYPGEIIGYIGPNGAGKSTTIKTILGIITEYEGLIEFKGEDILSIGPDYKRYIGYVSEGAEVYKMLTGAEYIKFLGKIYNIDEEEAYNKGLELMKIFEIEDAYDSKISGYSKGMRQKLVLIAALFHDPEVIFLDEPLNGIDANSIAIVKEVLNELSSRGKTIFYSSHILEVVEKISNRIIVINDGIIDSDCTIDELKDRNFDDSLESIFNNMTGENNQKELANKFIQIIAGSGSNAV